jgi:membrane-bound lytic murein transglycosylase D
MLNRKFKFIAGHSLLLLISLPAGSHYLDTSALSQNTAFSVDNIATAKVAAKADAVHLNRQATHFVKDYIRRNDETLTIVKKRGEKHFPMMDSVFNRYNLPVELKYLAVIESELKSTATSNVGAKGPWQFMPETAKLLGLKVSSRYDERENYRKSTKAAAIYLKDLHREFGDWLLVLAAYNSGPGPVYAAIKKSGSCNFWKLQNYLPAESRGHVKKFIATHYYFEGQGGITTLTKAEMQKLLAIK